jgi:hypothetical protein
MGRVALYTFAILREERGHEQVQDFFDRIDGVFSDAESRPGFLANYRNRIDTAKVGPHFFVPGTHPEPHKPCPSGWTSNRSSHSRMVARMVRRSVTATSGLSSQHGRATPSGGSATTRNHPGTTPRDGWSTFTTMDRRRTPLASSLRSTRPGSQSVWRLGVPERSGEGYVMRSTHHRSADRWGAHARLRAASQDESIARWAARGCTTGGVAALAAQVLSWPSPKVRHASANCFGSTASRPA